MNIDLKAHYQALYDALDAAIAVPVFHVTAADTQTGLPVDMPYVVYRQEVERALVGTPGSGQAKVMGSNWVITAYSVDLEEALGLVSDALNSLVDEDLITTDGYHTTAIIPVGVIPVWEKDGKNYAVHGRIRWERSL
jgi:hypothetical protein